MNNNNDSNVASKVANQVKLSQGDPRWDQVTKYLGDMIGLESHIYQAVDKQVKETQDHPDVNALLTQIRDACDSHMNALRSRLEAMGGKYSHPVKEAGASVLGVAAGVIDKLRAEEESKDLRDTYTALSLCNISYVMFAATALGCGDQESAQLAHANLKEHAGNVTKIGKVIPDIVIRNLSDAVPDIAAGAADQAREIYSQAWQQ